jgi:hypothetical protein
MAYYNGFPATYQPVYQVPQTQNQQSSIIWVQGEAGAKSYMVAPNSTVTLWDSENQTIYLKSADASGMPSIKTLDYTIREARNGANTAPVITDDKLSTFATKDEIKAVSDRITAISERLDKMEVAK